MPGMSQKPGVTLQGEPPEVSCGQGSKQRPPHSLRKDVSFPIASELRYFSLSSSQIFQINVLTYMWFLAYNWQAIFFFASFFLSFFQDSILQQVNWAPTF
jgi:hypothetical protein